MIRKVVSGCLVAFCAVVAMLVVVGCGGQNEKSEKNENRPTAALEQMTPKDIGKNYSTFFSYKYNRNDKVQSQSTFRLAPWEGDRFVLATSLNEKPRVVKRYVTKSFSNDGRVLTVKPKVNLLLGAAPLTIHVKWRGRVWTLQAQVVIVATGVMNTPQLRAKIRASNAHQWQLRVKWFNYDSGKFDYRVEALQYLEGKLERLSDLYQQRVRDRYYRLIEDDEEFDSLEELIYEEVETRAEYRRYKELQAMYWKQALQDMKDPAPTSGDVVRAFHGSTFVLEVSLEALDGLVLKSEKP